MAYSEQVVQRFEAVLANPHEHAVGTLDRKDPKVATGLAGAPACGDVMQLQLKLDENDRIVDVKFKTYGCGSAIASSSLFVDLMMGKTVEEAKLIKDKDIALALDLPPIKLHCSVLAEDAIRQAMVDYESKNTPDYTHPILDQRPTESEVMQSELEPIYHPTEHDESDELEDSKRIEETHSMIGHNSNGLSREDFIE
jgi:nitrogen fixation NifU-like protein